ncbi:MAG: NUDIX hydrolase [Ktedonobacteraceae bacterium]
MADDATSPVNPQIIAQNLALWADILRGCSARGLRFASNIYDQENYQQIQHIALELLALATAQPLVEIEPLRATIFARAGALPTGDAAIIDPAGRILLIRRADNGLWAMPGGGLEVGETPAQGVVREALEETGVACEPIALIGVHDSRLCGKLSPYHLYQFSFLCRPLPHIKTIDPSSHAHEVREMHWFLEHALPDDLDPGHVQRIPEAFRVWHGDQRAYFDLSNEG